VRDLSRRASSSDVLAQVSVFPAISGDRRRLVPSVPSVPTQKGTERSVLQAGQSAL